MTSNQQKEREALDIARHWMKQRSVLTNEYQLARAYVGLFEQLETLRQIVADNERDARWIVGQWQRLPLAGPERQQ